MNMKTIMNKINTFQPVGVLAVICAVLFAVALFAVPSQAAAYDDYYDGGDWGYYSDAGGKGGDSYYDGGDWGYYNDDNGGNYETVGNDYQPYEYETVGSDYYTSCSSCGGSNDYYTPSYSSYSTPGYSYSTPQYSYSTPSYSNSHYVSTPSYSNSTPSYVYASNTAVANANSQSNSAANSSSNSSVGNITNNNVNNNTVVVNVPNTPSTPTTPTTPTLDGYCTINPSYANVNQDVTLSAIANGGSGNYSYSWSGSDGIYSNSQSFTGRFGTAGTKTATVTIQSGNQSITRTCNVNIQNQNNTSLSAYCVANPSVSNIGQTVTWTAYVNGGTNGNYTYSWNGSDGLYGNNQTAYMNYNSFGTKTANVTVYANGQTVSASCNMTVQGQTAGVTVIRTPDQGTPVSGIYLSQIPATGIDFNMKTILFTLGLVIWSAFVAYVMINRRKNAMVLSGNVGSAISAATKAEAFKLANMQKRGIAA